MLNPSFGCKGLGSRWSFNNIPDFNSWERLAGVVKDFQPDYVVLLARKMTRLWQDMRRRDGKKFLKGCPTLSHYALDYVESLKGQRVAIIDDALNVGTTMKHVCEKLVRLGVKENEIGCFALFAKEGFHPENVGRFAPFLNIIETDYVDEAEYHSRSARLNHSLLQSGMPLELEFPVYELHLENSQDFFKKSIQREEKERCNWVTEIDADLAGFDRLSLMRSDTQGNSIKFRFYFDKHHDRLLCVPMVFPTANSPRFSGKAELFAYGQKEMESYLPMLKKHGVKSWILMDEDAQLLFGRNFDQSLLEKDLCRKREISRELPDMWFLDVLKKCPSFMEETQDLPRLKSLRRAFVRLFTTLGHVLGEHDPEKLDIALRENFPPEIRQKVDKDGYCRLCLGLTFSEIATILKLCWKGSIEKYHSTLSRLLDEHIDQGFVVPTLDIAGRRVFRKGEAVPQDRALFYALNIQGADANFGEDLEIKLASLKDESRDECLRFLECLENGDE